MNTMTKPPTIATAPQSIGLRRELPSIILTTVSPTPHAKQAHTLAGVTPRQYSPSINGARNAPASAPQDMPMS